MTLPTGVAARAILLLDSGRVVYVEVKLHPTFYRFYSAVEVGRNHKGRRELLVCLNQGQARDLPEAAKKILAGMKTGMGSGVLKEIKIYRKRDYQRLLNTSPDELGLARCSASPLPGRLPARRIPIDLPALKKQRQWSESYK